MPDVVAVILMIAMLLGLASLILPLADRLALPSAMLLAGLGMALGLAASAFGHLPGLGILGDVLTGLSKLGLPTDAFLFLFLPPLLFTAALTIDVRLLLDEFAAVLLLAVVAVAVATAVVGYALSAVTEFGLIACLLLGAIVATTDPAAVLSIFRDLGAPRRLTTLIAGESLFNDAAAIAIFALLLDVLVGARDLSLADGLLAILIEFLGGVLVGVVLARLACSLLHRLRNTRVAEVTVTVSLAYLSYVVADHYLEVSGVIAVVAAGLTVAIYGRTRLSAGAWEPLVQTWTQLDFWANSLIFLLTAILASRVLPAMSVTELGLLAVLVLAALAARALVLYGLLPVLVRLGLTEPTGARHKVVILWGGLRGAVTMVLALSISQNPFVPPVMQDFVAQLAVAYVLFTLFVAAPTLRPLLRLLGLNRLDPTELALRNRVMALSRAQIRDQVAATGRDYGFDPSLVERVAPDRPLDHLEETDEAEGPMGRDSRLRVGLLTLANREKEIYLEHFDDGTVSRETVGQRVAAADRTLDRIKTQGQAGYEESSRADVALPRAFALALWLHRRFALTAPLARQVARRFEALLVSELAVRELRRFNRRSVQPVLGARTSSDLAELLARRLQMIEDAVAAVELQFPTFAEALRLQYLALAGLRFEDSEYRRKLDEGLISREVFNDLQRALEDRRAAIERQPPLDIGEGLQQMLRRVNVFAGLDRSRLMFIARLLRPRFALPGELILKQGERGFAMYFIAAGTVEVTLQDRTVPLGPGEFFGELALLTKKPRNADVTALSYCHLLELQAGDLQRLVRTDGDLKEAIEAIAQQRLHEGRPAEPVGSTGPGS